MPFALDAIRKLGERVTRSTPPTATRRRPAATPSTSPATSSPPRRRATERFVADVERIAAENEIELVLPMFEEVFYLAAQHERLSEVTTLYAPPFRTLAQVHDKGTFQELCEKLGIRTPQTVVAQRDDELREAIGRFPRYFARAAFSRGGVGPAHQHRPAGRPRRGRGLPPDRGSPWLVQEFVDGPMQCTYTPLHGGRVASHMSYRAPRQWEHSTGIQFVSVDAGRDARDRRADRRRSSAGRPDVARLRRGRRRADDDRVQPAADRRHAADDRRGARARAARTASRRLCWWSPAERCSSTWPSSGRSSSEPLKECPSSHPRPRGDPRAPTRAGTTRCRSSTPSSPSPTTSGSS